MMNARWDSRIPDNEWTIYRKVIREARESGIPFAFGGAFATAVYTGEFMNTKDFDFYILPVDRDRMVQAISRAGLDDYYDQRSYDRSWIYRASRDEIIVDAIWAMANHRTDVDEGWLIRGPAVEIRGEKLRAIPVEELIWSKLYVLQRERSDWGDVFKLLDARLREIDWDRLLAQLGDDTRLFAGALAVYGWLAPDRADVIPDSVWQRVGVRPPAGEADGELTRRRAALLDSRPWFRVSSVES
jgi:Nucleotidyl transferase of unknown function (DUF2204)